MSVQFYSYNAVFIHITINCILGLTTAQNLRAKQSQ